MWDTRRPPRRSTEATEVPRETDSGTQTDTRNFRGPRKKSVGLDTSELLRGDSAQRGVSVCDPKTGGQHEQARPDADLNGQRPTHFDHAGWFASTGSGSGEAATRNLRLANFDLRYARRRDDEKAGEDQAPVVAMTVPDVIRVCAPLKCVYVEKIEYCAPSSSCGQSVIITNWGTPACPSGYKCFTDAHGRHKTLSSGVSWPADRVGNAVECAVNIGFGVGAGVTKGWGWGAAAGAALAAWGCRNI